MHTPMPDHASTTHPGKQVLPCALAGSWYDADPKRLRAEIEETLRKAPPTNAKDVIALILPHAGYRYSGAVAAHAVQQVVGAAYDRVIVMGPTHHCPIENAISVPDVTHYETPLGEVPLDLDFIARLKKLPFVMTNREAHRNEHSVQIEVPFLQVALGTFKLVPIVCGQLSPESAKAIGHALAELVDERTLVVTSSDFTHYGSRFGYVPFRTDLPANLRKLDMGAFAFIENKDADGFMQYVSSTGATICGRHPIAVLLAMLPANASVHLLKYDTSGQLLGDYSSSVSYVAADVTGAWGTVGARQEAKTEPAATLSAEDKAGLLKLARGTLTDRIRQGRVPTPADLGVEITPGMKQIMGAFVTLHENGELRGCIGEIVPRREVYKAVMDRAIDSALKDPRFSPLSESEIDKVVIEISALSQPRSVSSYRDIVLGKHGIVLQKGMRSAVFLPQVAPEQGWDLPTTLTHLAMKAGLSADGWKQDAEFMVFEAIVFGEE